MTSDHPPIQLPEPWSAQQATDRIRAMAKMDDLSVTFSEHATDQMLDRDLILSDVLYVMKNGFCYDRGVATERLDHFKYAIECDSPNSGRREVRVILKPALYRRHVKIITVMWADEPMQQG